MDRDKALWIMWGRQVRPGSLWLSVVTGAVGVNAALGRTVLVGRWEDIAGIVALLAAGCLWAGWWAQSIKTAAVGYQAAAGVWAFVALTASAQLCDPLSQTAIVAWCLAGLAGSLFLRDRRET